MTEITTNQHKPAVDGITIDCVFFGFNKESLEVLLVQHAEGESKGKWGLLGGWLQIDESADNAAQRILQELTGLENIYLEQLKAFTNPQRVLERRVVTIGYYTLVNREDYNIKASLKVFEAKWFKINEIPELIFDHNEILDFSLLQLRNRVRQAPIGFNLLPEKFTLLQLMHLYEEILGIELDKSNFRRKVLHMKLLTALDEKQKDVSHRAAKLYKFDPEMYKKLTEKGFNFEF
ncbi:bifunctional nicotinamide mononucleotide adenylyltransferase/ADP-ribose pyrophosphatase [Flavobacterium sp. ACN2]|uniref:NUDIX hydrolase n=1 Tax=unclassified Flavobacterium TaxID=196869 RepID=UPI000BB34F4B|nr:MULTISPECIES: NUDIX domain-containing protein [unclassified Flavobacterium]MDY0990210.1 NUDIX domain-containing protein [Flavobacterium sp. CFBP9031]PBI92579.1 bifunctional nicotinamide mononucleotide adenylyltransferase/ADP-ribose pyrophosphatase [Flavobacterium sp. ACN2]